MSCLAFDALKSELGALVNTLQSHFWAGFHPSQFLCTKPHRQLVNHHLWTEVQLPRHIFHILSAA